MKAGAYRAVALDVHSRRIVGWSIASSQTAALATDALGMAIANRAPSASASAVIHFDHGVQFTSWAATRRAQGPGLVPLMGTIGDRYDNAVIKSFWGHRPNATASSAKPSAPYPPGRKPQISGPRPHHFVDPAWSDRGAATK